MPKIVPIKDLRDTNKISELCHSVKMPVFVTKNGYDDMVIMSSEVYDSMLYRQSIIDAVLEGTVQIDNGEGIDGESVKKSLGEKYGFRL